MTCKQLGGACELNHVAGDADEIIKAHDHHLREVVAAGDEAHASALRDLRGRRRRPVSGLKWYRQVQRDFDALPSDPGER